MLAALAADQLWGPPTGLALERLGDLTGKSVVELGCGRGQLAVTFAMMGAKVHALDLDPARLEIDESWRPLGGRERCEFLLARSEAATFPMVARMSVLRTA